MTPPIVMQTFWRTRGTYFWSLFRANGSIRAFYEPLHESLATSTEADLQKHVKAGTASRLRHPASDDHYFKEFPFRSEGGVPYFKGRFSYDSFILDERDSDPELREYLAFLVEHADRSGQTAFFKFTRAGLRSRFVKAALGGTHIYLNRPASEIADSIRSFGPLSYFTAILVFLTNKHRDRDYFGSAANVLRHLGPYDPSQLPDTFPSSLTPLHLVSHQLNREQIEFMTAAFWLAYLLEGLVCADVVVDSEALGCDPRQMGLTLRALAPWLDAGALHDYRSSPCDRDLSEYAEQLKQCLAADRPYSSLAAMLPAEACRALGPASLRLLDRIL